MKYVHGAVAYVCLTHKNQTVLVWFQNTERKNNEDNMEH